MALHGTTIAAILPALNEADSIGHVLQDLPAWIDHVIVVDNGSTDTTAAIASAHGATVVAELFRGYGAACLRGIAEARRRNPDVVLFLDADYSDYPEDVALVLDPVCSGAVVFCLGSRTRGERQRGALLPQQIFGNWLATTLLRLFWRSRFTDLGPMRAIRMSTLEALAMTDRTYGWTIEMQIGVLKRALPYAEVAVRYRQRIGTSKIAGTVRGSVKAGIRILGMITRHAFR